MTSLITCEHMLKEVKNNAAVIVVTVVGLASTGKCHYDTDVIYCLLNNALTYIRGFQFQCY